MGDTHRDTLLTAAERLDRENDILQQQVERLADEPSDVELGLAVSQSKRVRSQSTLVVRALARLREQLQPGGTS